MTLLQLKTVNSKMTATGKGPDNVTLSGLCRQRYPLILGRNANLLRAERHGSPGWLDRSLYGFDLLHQPRSVRGSDPSVLHHLQKLPSRFKTSLVVNRSGLLRMCVAACR